MIIDEIIGKIDGKGPRSYYLFETFIFNLFENHLKTQNKKFEVLDNALSIGDAIAPDGIDTLDGATLIEVKYNLNRIQPRDILNHLISQVNHDSRLPKVSNVLIISAQPITNKLKFYFEKLANQYQLGYVIVLWGPEELNRIATKNRKFVNSIARNLFALRLESAISKPIKDWKLEREGIIEKLKTCYQKGQFSLFLGAGVSSSAGMPGILLSTPYLLLI